MHGNTYFVVCFEVLFSLLQCLLASKDPLSLTQFFNNCHQVVENFRSLSRKVVQSMK